MFYTYLFYDIIALGDFMKEKYVEMQKNIEELENEEKRLIEKLDELEKKYIPIKQRETEILNSLTSLTVTDTIQNIVSYTYPPSEEEIIEKGLLFDGKYYYTEEKRKREATIYDLEKLNPELYREWQQLDELGIYKLINNTKTKIINLEKMVNIKKQALKDYEKKLLEQLNGKSIEANYYIAGENGVTAVPKDRNELWKEQTDLKNKINQLFEDGNLSISDKNFLIIRVETYFGQLIDKAPINKIEQTNILDASQAQTKHNR